MPDMFKEELETKLNALVGDAKAAGYGGHKAEWEPQRNTAYRIYFQNWIHK